MAVSHEYDAAVEAARSKGGPVNREQLLLAVLGALILACIMLCRLLGDLTRQAPLFLVAFTVAFAAYLAAAWLVLRRSMVPDRRWWAILLVVALAARLVMLVTPPTLSDDLYRYVWEGDVLARGFNPYALPPDSPRLVPLRDAIWLRINNKNVPSPYPPLAQVIGLLDAVFFPHSTFGPKLFALLGDLTTLVLVHRLIQAVGGPTINVILYAWNPLVIVEFALSGHNDSVMVALLLAAILVGIKYPTVGGLLLGLAALAKATPLLTLPLVWRRWGPLPAVLAGAIFAAGYLPFLPSAGGTVGSLPRYLATFADNDSIHAVLRESVALWHRDIAIASAKAITLGLTGATLGAFVLVPRLKRLPLWYVVYLVLASALLLASTVHAWYVTWLLPFLAPSMRAVTGWLPFRPLPSFGWLLFSGLVALPYLTYHDHVWHVWISAVEYVPLFLLLAGPLLTRWRLQRIDCTTRLARSSGSAAAK